MYQKNVENGYIISIVTPCDNGNITADEYNAILAAIHSRPAAPAGHGYRLREDLTWELYELPAVEPEDEDATEDDYRAALNELGVSTDEEE